MGVVDSLTLNFIILIISANGISIDDTSKPGMTRERKIDRVGVLQNKRTTKFGDKFKPPRGAYEQKIEVKI